MREGRRGGEGGTLLVMIRTLKRPPSRRFSMTDLNRLTAALSDRYTIEHEVGAGGMATVYLAHDLRHDRKVPSRCCGRNVESPATDTSSW